MAIGCVLIAIRFALGKPLCSESGMAPAESLASGWIVAALIGYTMAAGRYLNAAILGDVYESAGRDRAAIRELDDMQVYSTALPVLRRSRLAGALGAVIGLFILQSVRNGIGGADGQLADPELLLWMVIVPLSCFLLARATFNTLLGVRDRSDATPQPNPLPIDLLDLRSVYAQGRIGLRLALVWIAGGTISSLFIFDPQLVTPILPLLLSGIAVAVAALLMPARRLHRNIREAKYRELDQLQSELHRVRDDVSAGRATEGGRLADLLAYRSYLEEIREWPFDNPTMMRFLLYLMIPIGSWLGGALVERVVSDFLD